MRFYFNCASGQKISYYVYNLQQRGFKFDVFTDGFHIYYYTDIPTISHLILLKLTVDDDIIIQENVLGGNPELRSKYPDYEFPEHEILVYDDYIE